MTYDFKPGDRVKVTKNSELDGYFYKKGMTGTVTFHPLTSNEVYVPVFQDVTNNFVYVDHNHLIKI